MARVKYKAGWFTFADGYACWFSGLSAKELKQEEALHGKLISYNPC